MLTRELCERLQEAGYEQVLTSGDRYYDDMGGPYMFLADEYKTWRDDYVKCPPTDELIEAVRIASLAEHGECLTQVRVSWMPGEGWCAACVYTTLKSDSWDCVTDDDLPTALAELWLKLKESGR